jgi:hypothetical protein
MPARLLLLARSYDLLQLVEDIQSRQNLDNEFAIGVGERRTAFSTRILR